MSNGEKQEDFIEIPEHDSKFDDFTDSFYNHDGAPVRKKDVNGKDTVETKLATLRHYVGTYIVPLHERIEFVAYAKSKGKTLFNNPIVDFKEYIDNLYKIVSLAPSETWIEMLKQKGLNPNAEQWKDVGTKFIELAERIKNATTQDELEAPVNEFWDLFKLIKTN